MPDEREFQFGDLVKDKFTDFQGFVLGKVQYYNGCNKVAIQSKTLKDGAILSLEWLDEQQVILVEAADSVNAPPPAGGPMQSPP